MKSNIFKKLVAGVATLAMVAQFGFVLPASAEIIKTDVFALQTFDAYTAPTNTEVIADPDDATNKILKVSKGASFNFDGVFSTDDTKATTLIYDINYATDTTGTATKNKDGVYFEYNGNDNQVASLIKIYGATKDSKVPVGFSRGGGTGQYGPAGDATVGTWYTVVNVVDKLNGKISFKYYDRDEYAANPSGATAKFSKEWEGNRNSSVAKAVNLAIYHGGADGEYFYIDNVHSYTETDTEATNELRDFTFETPGSVIMAPADADAIETKDIKLKLSGTMGDLTAAECDSITWSHKGTEVMELDGYVGYTLDENSTDGSISIKNGVANCFGYIDATVTKGEKTITKRYRYMISNGATAEAGRIYPAAGYPVNMNEYPDSLVEYMTMNGTINDKDPILANWASVGSNGARSLTLQKEEESGDKYIQISDKGGPDAAGNSTVAGVTIANQGSQIIFEFDAKLPAGASVVYANTTQNNTRKDGYAFNLDGTTIKSGDGQIADVTADEWHKYIVSYDQSIKKYYVKVFDMSGNKLGEITNQSAASDADPSVFSLGGAFPIGIKNMKVYKPVAASMNINAASTTVKVPEEGEDPQTLGLSAEMLTADGLEVTGDVTWAFEDGEVANVSITRDESNPQAATVKVASGAASGEITVVASMGSAIAKKKIKLTSSSNNVAFTKSVSNVQIPFTGEADFVYEFKAETRDGQGNPLTTDDTITYKLLDSTGSKEADINGVSFKNGVLTVKPGATAAIVQVQAENKEGLTANVKVNIHGMNFAFGSDEPEEGYTKVTAASLYTDTAGFGFASTSGLTDEAKDVKGSSAYKVQVKVPNGNYKVNVTTTSASMTSEAAVGGATGINKTGSSFDVAVCDGILDLTFAADSTISKLSLSQAAVKAPNAKPAIYSIGDSTTKNSGHYSKYNADKEAQKSDPSKWVDERLYGSWGNCVTPEMYNDTFSSYANHGQAGRNSVNFYNQGRVESVLLSVAPGDYVTINMGINWGDETEYETMIKTYYINGVLQRGAIPVILGHTPAGPVGRGRGDTTSEDKKEFGYYDDATEEFHEARENCGRVKLLKQWAEEMGLNFIDIGKLGNDYLNTLTTDDLNKANTANSVNVGYTAPTNVLELVQSWYPDHNHYTSELGTVYAQIIIDELKKIQNNPFVLESVTKTATADKITLTAAIKDGASAGSATLDAYVAQYVEGKLVKIEKTPVTFTNSSLTAELTYAKEADNVEVKVYVWDANQKPYLADTTVAITE